MSQKTNSAWSHISYVWKWDIMEGITYYVPTTLLVLASIWLPPKILAVPKSDIFGFISSSNSTLLAFKSLWMILSRESSWRYWMPLAIPLTMFIRRAQLSSLHFFGSAFVIGRQIVLSDIVVVEALSEILIIGLSWQGLPILELGCLGWLLVCLSEWDGLNSHVVIESNLKMVLDWLEGIDKVHWEVLNYGRITPAYREVNGIADFFT